MNKNVLDHNEEFLILNRSGDEIVKKMLIELASLEMLFLVWAIFMGVGAVGFLFREVKVHRIIKGWLLNNAFHKCRFRHGMASIMNCR